MRAENDQLGISDETTDDRTSKGNDNIIGFQDITPDHTEPEKAPFVPSRSKKRLKAKGGQVSPDEDIPQHGAESPRNLDSNDGGSRANSTWNTLNVDKEDVLNFGMLFYSLV